MHKAPIGIIGASGYSGLELTRILAAHPQVELRFLTSDRWVGEKVGSRAGVLGPAGSLSYVPVNQARSLAQGCAAVFLATPAEASLEQAPGLLEAGAKVVDLSGAYRLKDATAYPRYYKLDHAQPALLAEAVYGLPELFRSDIPHARLVANPGCYATAAALQLSPLIESGLVDPSTVVISAASGVTGAGRKASEDFSFTEVDGDYRAYKVIGHQHTPEISQTVTRAAKVPFTAAFTPHLLPLRRGILSTAYARLAPGVSAAAVQEALATRYRDEPFITVARCAEEVSLKRVVGTNRCLIGASCELEPGRERVVVISAIDNLVKGAAGQAVQNMNLMMGFAETDGLLELRAFYP